VAKKRYPRDALPPREGETNRELTRRWQEWADACVPDTYGEWVRPDGESGLALLVTCVLQRRMRNPVVLASDYWRTPKAVALRLGVSPSQVWQALNGTYPPTMMWRNLLDHWDVPETAQASEAKVMTWAAFEALKDERAQDAERFARLFELWSPKDSKREAQALDAVRDAANDQHPGGRDWRKALRVLEAEPRQLEARGPLIRELVGDDLRDFMLTQTQILCQTTGTVSATRLCDTVLDLVNAAASEAGIDDRISRAQVRSALDGLRRRGKIICPEPGFVCLADASKV